MLIKIKQICAIKEGLHPPHTQSTNSNVRTSKGILIFPGNIFPQQNLIYTNHRNRGKFRGTMKESIERNKSYKEPPLIAKKLLIKMHTKSHGSKL